MNSLIFLKGLSTKHYLKNIIIFRGKNEIVQSIKKKMFSKSIRIIYLLLVYNFENKNILCQLEFFPMML